MSPSLLRCARFFHRSPAVRRFVRRIGRGFTVRQPFHDGVICMDAVDHSWSWIGGRPLETFDRDVQDRLLSLVATRGLFIDVGCNVGVMTLAVLLRDARARAVCVAPPPLTLRCRLMRFFSATPATARLSGMSPPVPVRSPHCSSHS